MLRRGLGLSQSTITLNVIRAKNNHGKVARTTVRDSVRALVGAESRRTVKRATGNKDKDSSWAKARRGAAHVPAQGSAAGHQRRGVRLRLGLQLR